MKNQKVLTKLEKLEREILKIKKGSEFKLPKKPISLKGILKGVKLLRRIFRESKILVNFERQSYQENL